MTITYLQLFTFVFAVIVFMLTPGPGVFATIARSMTHGAWSVIPLALGLALGDSIYMVLSAYGLSALATNYNGLFTVIKFLGAAYLFYLAYKMWVTMPAEIEADDVALQDKNDAVKGFISGALISSSNPKVILFYISLLPSFFPVASLNTIDVTVLCLVIFFGAVIAMAVYAIIADYAQKQLKSPQSRLKFNRVGASLMGFAGGWLIAKG